MITVEVLIQGWYLPSLEDSCTYDIYGRGSCLGYVEGMEMVDGGPLDSEEAGIHHG